ncbi:hypothetical protein KY348_01840 [Candidatus Woesearchaeota archaeon]|nr:hypothetical protein [Candidatus Woesearchaeota archaeon]
MTDAGVMISKDEYALLRQKADLFDHMIEVEELTKEELVKVKKALKGPFITKAEFLKKNPDLA